MEIKRRGSAAWRGGSKHGGGTLSTQSGALRAYPYSCASRLDGHGGSNPEELIAAAHASSFTMTLSSILGDANLAAEQLNTLAEVTVERVDGDCVITSVHLTLKAKISSTDQAAFVKLADMAKMGCPVSKLIKADVTLIAILLS